MYNPRGLNQYKQDDITTMPPEKIVVALYERLIEDLQDATAAAEQGDRLAMTKALNHANLIVSELRLALDHDIGGEIAANLDSLYNFVFSEILEQLVDREPRHARNAIDVLAPLLDSWRQIPVGTAERAAREQASGMDPASSGIEEATAPPASGPPAGVPGTETMTGTLSVSA